MNKQDRLFKIRDVEEFEREGTNEDVYNSLCPNWILMNGDLDRNLKPEGLTQWKKNAEDACRACFKTYTKGFNSSRVLVVFLLHSKSSDVFIEACAQLCLQSEENFACIAEDENVARTWQAGLMKYDYVEKTVLDKKIVAGLPWDFVGDIGEITTQELQTEITVATSIGPQKLSIKKELCDLSILGSNECDNDKIVEDAEKLDEFLKTKETEFYKGGEVNWWNFWSGGVCKRDVISGLCDKIQDALFLGFGAETEQDIKTLHLNHQPGSGGTTCARQVLWDFREKVKCAEILCFTESTSLLL